ncbi:hypothetical protein [Streptococcus cristatus]|uniref:hypothetical protein n=1 Tax=Streptococcus cristatus TaxID=45634 RepID=UPI0028D2F495|nr:hypothetical protein [Streptococcus cristatus]
MTIDELYDTVSIIESHTEIKSYLEKFKEVYWSLADNEKQEKLDIISKTFFHILKKFQCIPSEDETDIINELITSIAVTQISKAQEEAFICGEYEFFRLLNNLQINDTSNSAEVYKLLGEDISDVDWIFSLSKNGKFLYPLGAIMNDVINSNCFDIKTLFNLSFLLRIYVKHNINDDKILEKIDGLSKKYNIKCLEYIRKGGKQLLSSHNVCENGTMIFRYNEKVLIRSSKSDYFDTKETIEEEKDSKDNIIAYFIEYSLPTNDTKFLSLTEFLQKAEASSKKFEFIQRVYEKKHFNNFYKDAIYFDKQTLEYEFLNPYGYRDEKIIISNGKRDNIYNNSIAGFSELLNDTTKHYSLRQSIIWSRKQFDILTLDFFSELTNLNKETIIFNLEEISELDFLQNFFFKQYLQRHGYFNEDRILNYLGFIEDNVFNLKNGEIKMNDNMKLIFPYKIYAPDCFSDICYLYKNKLEDIQGEFSQFKICKRGLEKYIEVNGKKVVIKDIEKNTLNPADIEDLDVPSSIKEGFFDQQNSVLYYDKKLTAIAKKLIDFNQKIENYLAYDVLESKSDTSLKSIINLMAAIKLDDINYDVFSVRTMEESESILWFKLMWHFVIMEWESEEINSFLDLVLNRHYIGCALEYKDIVESWYKSIEEMISEDSNLVFRKEKMYDTTLDNYITEVSRSKGGKQLITKTDFDHRKVHIENNKLYYDRREIKTIVILVDNIMGGTSLKNALHHYFINGSEPDIHGKYFPCSPELKEKGLKNLNVKVIVKAIWSFPDIISDTKSLNDDSFKLSIQPEEIIDNYYKCNDDVIRITQSLYEKSEEAEYLIFRQKNMPYKSVFPKKVTDTTNLIGLFNRSKELK